MLRVIFTCFWEITFFILSRLGINSLCASLEQGCYNFKIWLLYFPNIQLLKKESKRRKPCEASLDFMKKHHAGASQCWFFDRRLTRIHRLGTHPRNPLNPLKRCTNHSSGPSPTRAGGQDDVSSKQTPSNYAIHRSLSYSNKIIWNTLSRL